MHNNDGGLRVGERTWMDLKTIRVWMVTHFFPPLLSGAAKQAITLGCTLSNYGIKVYFLTATESERLIIDAYDSMCVYRLPVRGDASSWRYTVEFFLKSLFFLLRKRDAAS